MTASPLPTPSGPAAANAASASFASLLARLDYLDAADIELVRKAYRYADEAHLGQKRKNGEPYITHPIAVAALCADWKLDAQALMAALLHDAMEDCSVTKTDLIERFGSPVAELVDGLTKLEKLEFSSREENQAESFRKMLLAMARDVRVILIKLSDRTHNMRTMSDMPRSKWGRISSETMEIYAPIAHRLGLNQTYRELQELSFKHLMPWRAEVLEKAVNRARNRRRDLIQRVQKSIEQAFAAHGLQVRIAGREKPVYSIYRKMDQKNLSFAQVTDIYGFRLIVPTVTDCYTAMGLLHQIYKPVPGKFKDYIAIPKINGYQSLHTTLVGPSSVNVEFQMRTEPMHLVAESGVAAHWLYKTAPNRSNNAADLGTAWLKSLLDIQSETHDAAEFWDHIKVDLFPDAVYVFTPKGQIMALPRGATVVDFAYAIHSNVGDHTVGAQVAGEAVALRTELHNGDVVEIVTDDNATPNPAWLGFVRTGRARSKIRHHLKTMQATDSIALGHRLFEQALRVEGLDVQLIDDAQLRPAMDKLLRVTGSRHEEDLMHDLGLGRKIATIVAKRLTALLDEVNVRPDPLLMSRERFTAHETLSQGAIMLDGAEGGTVQFARCCRPVPGDGVLGYLGKGEGLTVHTATCPVAVRLKTRDAERFIEVAWSDEVTRHFDTTIIVTANNGKGVLARVAAALSSAEVDITHFDMGDEMTQTTVDMRFTIAVRDTEHLDSALRNVRRAPSVVRADRAKPAAD
jgi:GTP diphosphokinase / guanosine-3',5'-bis(diphosphate) 3'-diphosphatase